MRNDFEFTDLNKDERLVEAIRRLETKIGEQVGHEVNLIAYSPTPTAENDHLDSCRAGLED